MYTNLYKACRCKHLIKRKSQLCCYGCTSTYLLKKIIKQSILAVCCFICQDGAQLQLHADDSKVLKPGITSCFLILRASLNIYKSRNNNLDKMFQFAAVMLKVVEFSPQMLRSSENISDMMSRTENYSAGHSPFLGRKAIFSGWTPVSRENCLNFSSSSGLRSTPRPYSLLTTVESSPLVLMV